MASSGSFNGKLGYGSALQNISGSWSRGDTSTTFYVNLTNGWSSYSRSYNCTRGAWFEVRNSSGTVVGRTDFAQSTVNDTSMGNSCYGSMYGYSNNACWAPQSRQLTVTASGTLTLWACYNAWTAGSASGCTQMTGGGSIYVDPYTRQPSGATSSVTNVGCNSATGNVYVNDMGIPSNQLQQRFEYSLNRDFSGQITTSYTSARSGSWSITGLTPATTYYYRSYAKNNVGSTNSAIGSFTTKGTVGAISAANNTATNPDPYRLVFNLKNVNWDPDNCGSTTQIAKLEWTYVMDGKTYTFSQTFDSKQSEYIYDTGIDMDRVPDDETVKWTWTLTNSFAATKSAEKSIYCQMSYDAFVANADTNYQWVEADLNVSPSPGTKPSKKVRRVTKL